MLTQTETTFPQSFLAKYAFTLVHNHPLGQAVTISGLIHGVEGLNIAEHVQAVHDRYSLPILNVTDREALKDMLLDPAGIYRQHLYEGA